jgi:pyruvate dehydrogenase E1 component alpha subunit
MQQRDWMANHDPITNLARWLLEQKLADQPILDQIQTDVKSVIDSAVKFAMQAPYPPVSEVAENVYA